MMISVVQVGDLTFEIRFHENLRQDLQELAGGNSEERAIENILSDTLLGFDPHVHLFDQLNEGGEF